MKQINVDRGTNQVGQGGIAGMVPPALMANANPALFEQLKKEQEQKTIEKANFKPIKLSKIMAEQRDRGYLKYKDSSVFMKSSTGLIHSIKNNLKLESASIKILYPGTSIGTHSITYGSTTYVVVAGSIIIRKFDLKLGQIEQKTLSLLTDPSVSLNEKDIFELLCDDKALEPAVFLELVAKGTLTKKIVKEEKEEGFFCLSNKETPTKINKATVAAYTDIANKKKATELTLDKAKKDFSKMPEPIVMTSALFTNEIVEFNNPDGSKTQGIVSDEQL